MRATYWWLAVICVVSVGATILFRTPERWWIDLFLPGLAGAAASVFLALVFVDRVIRRRDAEAREHLRKGALRKSGSALALLAEMLTKMVKATLSERLSTPPVSLSDLLKPEFLQGLYELDFTAKVSPVGSALWADYTQVTTQAVRQELSAVIEKYAAALPPEYVERLDELHDDEFLAYVGGARTALTFYGWPENRVPAGTNLIHGTQGLLEAFVERFTRSVSLHNTLTTKHVLVPVRYFRDEWTPFFGSARLRRQPGPVDDTQA